MNQRLTESVVEEAALEWFAELGFGVLHGPDIDPDSDAPARAGFGDVPLPDQHWQPHPKRCHEKTKAPVMAEPCRGRRSVRASG